MQARRLLITTALIVAAVWGGSLGYMHLGGTAGFLDRIEASLTDLRSLALGTRTPPPIVSIVAIDNRTAAASGYPLSRATLARLIDSISTLKPKVVALDLLLVDPGPEDGDAALAAALRQVPSVIAAAGVFPESTQSVTRDDNDPLAAIPLASQMLLPLARFADAAATGVVNVSTDQTGTPRYVPLISRGAHRVDQSFPLRAASLALGINPAFSPAGLSLGDRHLPTDGGQRLPLTFYGPHGTIPTYSAADALDGKLPAKAVEGRVVVIGSTVTGGGDVFPTPFDPVLPGVEVMSTAITQLIAGDGLVRDHAVRLLDATAAFALPPLLISLLAWRRSAFGYATIAAVALVWVMLNLLAFAHGYFLREPVRQDVAVVFVDLSGFTGLSEAIGVTNVREVLSGFFELLDDEARAHGGAITSFMGDGAMILFGLPQASGDDAARAAACAVGLCRRMRGWLSVHPVLAGRTIGFKVGAHCGPVVASRLGTGARQQITATGDTVNVASRLMEVAAARHVELALSAALMLAAGADAAPLHSGRLEGPELAAIRGRAESVDVWLWQGHPL